MSTHNIGFYGELKKIIPELSSNTPPYQVLCLRGQNEPFIYPEICTSINIRYFLRSAC